MVILLAAFETQTDKMSGWLPWCYWLNSPHCLKQAMVLLVNSLRLRDAYMHHQMRPSLVQIMACRLFGAQPLSEPMLDYCQLDPCEHKSVKFKSKYNNFHWRKCISECFLQNVGCLVSASMCWIALIASSNVAEVLSLTCILQTAVSDYQIYWWFSETPLYLQCDSNGDTAFLY